MFSIMSRVIDFHFLSLLYFLFCSDCGAFALAFAEYSCFYNKKSVWKTSNVKLYRERLVCLLYHYGKMKLKNGYTSENEIADYDD